MNGAAARSALPGWSPTKVVRFDLVNHVVDQVRGMILDNGFQPESFLPGEHTLADDFGVSRTVVREALRVLSAQGLVTISHGRPAKVKNADHHASVETLRALFKRSNVTSLDLAEVRQVLETEIAALAAQRATRQHLRTLAADCEELNAAETKELRVQADLSFHEHLAEATGNPCFVRLIQTMRAMFVESIAETQERCGANVHDAILAAVAARDPGQARQAMLDHIRNTKILLKDVAAPRKKSSKRKSKASGDAG